MTCDDVINIEKTKKDICIWGCGKIGTGDGYKFIRAMLPSQIKCFYDSNINAGTHVIDGLYTVDFEYVKANSENMTIIVMVADYRGIIDVLQANDIEDYYVLDEAMIIELVPAIALREERFISRLDEFRKVKSVEIQIETTSICNAKCKFCPNATLKRNKNVMTEQTFDLIIERIKKEHINVSEFILHLNGEPLIDKNIIERVKILKKEFRSSRVRFTSNFSLANEKIIDDLLESGLDCLTISINATEKEEYEKTMCLDYDKTIKNVQELLKRRQEKNSKMEVFISIVETPENSNVVKEFQQKWAECGAKTRIMKIGNWVGSSENVVEETTIEPCKALYNTINILSNGEYALCCFDAEGIIKKSIFDTPIRDAWDDIILSNIRNTHLTKGRVNIECKNCNIV